MKEDIRRVIGTCVRGELIMLLLHQGFGLGKRAESIIWTLHKSKRSRCSARLNAHKMTTCMAVLGAGICLGGNRKYSSGWGLIKPGCAEALEKNVPGAPRPPPSPPPSVSSYLCLCLQPAHCCPFGNCIFSAALCSPPFGGDK